VATFDGDRRILEFPRLSWVTAVVAVATLGVSFWFWKDREPNQIEFPIPGAAIPLTVEVLNATTTDGLARRITRFLRHRGIDVVDYRSAPGSADSTTLVIRRGSDSSIAMPVRDALGVGRIVVDLDSGLLVDLTVILGQDARTIGNYP